MKKKDSAAKTVLTPSKPKKNNSLHIKPLKKIIIDIEIFCLIDLIVIYGLLFLTKDTTVAMVGVVWVGIIAWRGGVIAGLLGCNFIYLTSFLAMNIPPHYQIPMVYYFDNRIPGAVVGVMQSLITALVVGYISSLIHKLRNEISLREKIQKDLEQNIAQLDAFGHTVAHDLKNPLMVINMSIDSLFNDPEFNGNVKLKKRLGLINDSSKNMINIIQSILLLAGLKKIDQNEFKVFPVSDSVDEALKRLDFTLKSNDVMVRKPDSWPDAVGYAPWVTEIWVNYITNAIKYGGNPAADIKPVVELGYDKPENDQMLKSDCIRFWVKDNGEGISKEAAATLFKEFTRLHQTRGKEGHGLGLSIAKSIIEKLDGNVGVESDIGKGSRFYFTLPLNLKKKNN